MYKLFLSEKNNGNHMNMYKSVYKENFLELKIVFKCESLFI